MPRILFFATHSRVQSGLVRTHWAACVVTMPEVRTISGYESTSHAGQWFAFSVTPRLTEPILIALETKGFECFTPFQTVIRQWRDRTSRARVPAFPGYIFVRLDLRFRLPVLMTPGVRWIVGYGRQPVPVDDEEIRALQRVMRSGLPAESSSALSSGDRVQLTDGPLAGLSGMLIKHKTGDRVLVQVTLINRALAVDVDSNCVRLVANAPDRCAIAMSTGGL